jgi:hypothetical protein
MEEKAPPNRPLVFSWLLVLCLVGLDYFSTLAYLPSIAVEAAGSLAPLAILAVVVVTLFAAVPVYWYVVGRSPHGHGATGLLEKLVHGWFGKAAILVLLGFIGTDFVLTRSLSTADATTHLIHNPFWKNDVEWIAHNKDTLRGWLPAFLQGRFFDFWNEQLVITLLLSVLGFVFWALLQGRFTPWFMRLAAVVVVTYLLLTAFILGSGVFYFVQHPEIIHTWWSVIVPWQLGSRVEDPWALAGALGILFLMTFPQTALALSGFELSMASAGLIRGRPDDDPARPRGRIRDARKLLVVAAVVMSVFVVVSVLIVSLLIPPVEDFRGHAAAHRALAYLAHGQTMRDGTPASNLNPLFGPAFGTVYDLSTILILLLAGASATLGLRGVVPHYLARFGMQMRWAQKIGVIQHLFNLIILLTVVVFHASVSLQQWAYTTSVLALLTGASVAALLDLSERFRHSWAHPLVLAPFVLYTIFFFFSTTLTTVLNPSGLGIALAFVAVVFVTAFVSRWMRSMESRFESFAFADERSAARWQIICQLEFQVLVPHRAGGSTLKEKETVIRKKHRIAPEVPIIFIEAHLGDPSDFVCEPLLRIDDEDGREVIRVMQCASIAHALAALALEFRKVGRPPELIFGWSNENPLAANLHFLFLGEGNIPWMVHSLIHQAEPDPAKQPRIVIG